MSAAAEILNRSQSGLSRQVKELESELGVRIFARTKNNIVGLTPQGEEIFRIGQRILSDAENLRRVGSWTSTDTEVELRIATTHVHARYFLPHILKSFTERFPETLLTLQQRDPVDCCSALAAGDVDIALSTVDERLRHKIVAIPAYSLTSGVYVPKRHPLLREKGLTLKKLSEFPFIAYSPAFAMRMAIDDTFAKAGLRPRIVCTATDADVCKAYVEAGMGIAILAKLAFDPVTRYESDRSRRRFALRTKHRLRGLQKKCLSQSFIVRLCFDLGASPKPTGDTARSRGSEAWHSP